MTIEVNTVGKRCGADSGGLSCAYCYLTMDTRLNSQPPKLNHKKIQETLLKTRGKFSLFGGEPLLARMEDLETLWAFGLKHWGANGVQTSGRPITDDHIKLFKKYKVHVGFSIDGPGRLNDPRWAGSTEKTRKATDHSVKSLERCLKEGIGCGLISTLHRKNAAPDRIGEFLDWLTRLDSLKLGSLLIHVMERNGPVKYLALNEDETHEALIKIHEHPRENIQIAIFQDIPALLQGHDHWKNQDGSQGGVKCIWMACDPWTTPAVKGIDPDGGRSLCQRVHKDGVPWYPTQPGPLVRQLALRVTSQEEGGCQGCRFFLMCKGQCPGGAIDGDWRKRSRDCRTWYRLFEYFEDALKKVNAKPLSLRPELKRLEDIMVGAWKQGHSPTLKGALEKLRQRRSRRPGPDGHIDYNDHNDSGIASLLSGGEKVSDE